MSSHRGHLRFDSLNHALDASLRDRTRAALVAGQPRLDWIAKRRREIVEATGMASHEAWVMASAEWAEREVSA